MCSPLVIVGLFFRRHSQRYIILLLSIVLFFSFVVSQKLESSPRVVSTRKRDHRSYSRVHPSLTGVEALLRLFFSRVTIQRRYALA